MKTGVRTLLFITFVLLTNISFAQDTIYEVVKIDDWKEETRSIKVKDLDNIVVVSRGIDNWGYNLDFSEELARVDGCKEFMSFIDNKLAEAMRKYFVDETVALILKDHWERMKLRFVFVMKPVEVLTKCNNEECNSYVYMGIDKDVFDRLRISSINDIENEKSYNYLVESNLTYILYCDVNTYVSDALRNFE